MDAELNDIVPMWFNNSSVRIPIKALVDLKFNAKKIHRFLLANKVRIDASLANRLVFGVRTILLGIHTGWAKKYKEDLAYKCLDETTSLVAASKAYGVCEATFAYWSYFLKFKRTVEGGRS